MKKFLKIFAILFLGVFLMAGTSFSTPYADTEYAAYEYYQAVQGADSVVFDATYGVDGIAYDFWESGLTATFNFSLSTLGNKATNSALDMIDDVEGWGPPIGIPISDAFVSFTLYSIDTELEQFDVDLDVFLDSALAYNITLGVMSIDDSPLITLNVPMVDVLLTAWQNNPEGILSIDATPIIPEGFPNVGLNDFGIVEAGIGVNSAAPVPEPATILLLGSGLLGLVGYNRKRFSKKS